MSQYGVAEMGESEREEYTSWYDAQKHKVFDNRRVLEQYCQDEVTVLRQACQLFRRDFMDVGNVDIFLHHRVGMYEGFAQVVPEARDLRYDSQRRRVHL